MWLRWLYPKALWRMNKNERKVYLTFDDGPIPEATPFILETLRARGIKATFFVVGDNVRKYPELFEQVRQDGHVIGNHTFNHIYVMLGSSQVTHRSLSRAWPDCLRVCLVEVTK